MGQEWSAMQQDHPGDTAAGPFTRPPDRGGNTHLTNHEGDTALTGALIHIVNHLYDLDDHTHDMQFHRYIVTAEAAAELHERVDTIRELVETLLVEVDHTIIDNDIE